MTKMFKLFLVVILFLLVMMSAREGRAAVSLLLRELVEPSSIALDGRHIYIPDGTSIYIYDLEDFRLKSRVGRRGEGPREFLLDVVRGAEELFIDVRTPVLLVNSLGKVSFFNKEDGSYIRELKLHGRDREFKPLGSGFAGQGMTVEKGIQYRSVNIYDSRLDKAKEVFKVRHHFQMGEGLQVLPATMKFAVWGDELFIAWDEDFIIRVFDEKGDPLRTIRREYDRVKVTERFKEKVVGFFKTHKRYKQVIEMLNPRIIFPTTFPAIADMVIDGGKIYVTTYRVDDDGSGASQCLVLDPEGKLLKTLIIPLERRDAMLPYPYTISGGKLYQLIDEGEQWRLKVSEL